MDDPIPDEILAMDTRFKLIIALNERIRAESPEVAKRLRSIKREYFDGEEYT